jgi:hypothetical protein
MRCIEAVPIFGGGGSVWPARTSFKGAMSSCPTCIGCARFVYVPGIRMLPSWVPSSDDPGYLHIRMLVSLLDSGLAYQPYVADGIDHCQHRSERANCVENQCSSMLSVLSPHELSRKCAKPMLSMVISAFHLRYDMEAPCKVVDISLFFVGMLITGNTCLTSS